MQFHPGVAHECLAFLEHHDCGAPGEFAPLEQAVCGFDASRGSLQHVAVVQVGDLARPETITAVDRCIVAAAQWEAVEVHAVEATSGPFPHVPEQLVHVGLVVRAGVFIDGVVGRVVPWKPFRFVHFGLWPEAGIEKRVVVHDELVHAEVALVFERIEQWRQ